MKLSFVILTWNSARYVQVCFERISAALDGRGIDYEILVLDNGSSDGTVALLERHAREHGRKLRVFYEPENLGTTRSRNILLREARGEYVCIMDSDVEIFPGVIETLLAQLNERAGAGMVVPRIRYPSGNWQKSFDGFPTLANKINRFARLRAIEQLEGEKIGQGAHEPFRIDYAISAFWLMRRSLFERAGLLDEKIFYAPEDADFCLRVWKAGCSIWYVPQVEIIHHTQEISRGFKLNRAKWNHIAGLAYYFAKHRYLLRAPMFRAPAS
jgi:GT2 family glycosyltransferase